MPSEYAPDEQAKHREEWVCALREGGYEQGIQRLRTGDKFCCLGVACDISGLGKWATDSYEVPTGEGCLPESSETTLPSVVEDYFGLLSSAAILAAGLEIDGEDTLTGVNDGAQWNFEQIADLIESGKVRVVR